MEEWAAVVKRVTQKNVANREAEAATRIQRAFRVARATQGTLLAERATGVPVTQVRQQQLASLDRHYLSGLYGLRVISTMTNRERESDLWIGHPNSTSYQRDAWDKEWGAIKGSRELVNGAIAALLGGRSPVAGTSYCLVNSRLAARRLEFLAEGAKPILTERPRIAAGDPGLYLLEYKVAGGSFTIPWNTENKASAGSLFEEFCKFVGATPSSYQMYKFLHGQKRSSRIYGSAYVEPELSDSEAFDNRALLSALLASREYQKLKRMARVDRPMQFVYAASVLLINGLSNLSTLRRFKKGILVKSGLESLTTAVRMLALYDNHAERCRKAYDLLLDELFLILAATRPYRPNEISDNEALIQNRRIPTLARLVSGGRVRRLIHPAWSGMDALTTALEMAIAESGRDVQLLGEWNNSTYFEVGCILSAQGRPTEHSLAPEAAPRVIMATMNPSTPGIAGPTPEVIAGVVAARYRQHRDTISLIVDATIQPPPDVDPVRQLEVLVGLLAESIQAGHVQLILARSYQKYQALGSGKMMGGCTTLINARTLASSAGYLSGLDSSAFRGLDEVQFFAHILKYAADVELGLTGVASRNARYLGTSAVYEGKIISSTGRHEHNLPFVLAQAMTSWMKRLDVAEMDSFGFVVSSFLDIPDPVAVRLNPGQESKERLIEKFGAATYLWSDRQERGFNWSRVVSHVHSILRQVSVKYAGSNQKGPEAERLPFKPVEPPARGYAAPEPDAITELYVPPSNARTGQGTDLDHLMASYLSTAVRFFDDLTLVEKDGKKVLYRSLILAKDAAERLEQKRFLAKLYRGFFDRGLLSVVTTEMRGELSGNYLRLSLDTAPNELPDEAFNQVRARYTALLARYGAYAPVLVRKSILADAVKSAQAGNRLAGLIVDYLRQTSPLLAPGRENLPSLLSMEGSSGLALHARHWMLQAESDPLGVGASPQGSSGRSSSSPPRLGEPKQAGPSPWQRASALYAQHIRDTYNLTENPGGGDCMYYSFDDGLNLRTEEQAARISAEDRLGPAMELRVQAAAETARLIRLGVGIAPGMFGDMPFLPARRVELMRVLDQVSVQMDALRTQSWAYIRDRYQLVGRLPVEHAAEAEQYTLAAVAERRPLQALLTELAEAYEWGQSHRRQYASHLDYIGLVLVTGVDLRMHYVDSSPNGIAQNHGHTVSLYRYHEFCMQYHGRRVAPARRTIDIFHVNDNHYVFGIPK
ncbi:hypothetical protein [Hyalangium sp.]|uniref:hypothetical protein n=1 Tax=Hyalangium sp. TaxID=2028555 RepID=UPI002D63755D|nr:hypothetical protein [Hyalangium sp.]HYH97354.1 hypothetical protein [Hyalangium sp.]